VSKNQPSVQSDADTGFRSIPPDGLKFLVAGGFAVAVIDHDSDPLVGVLPLQEFNQFGDFHGVASWTA
jgi:hypothetical protein